MASRLPYSTGCHSCRKMKVKCDEEKPNCQRCTRAGRSCPGYRDASQLLFRSMNLSLEAKATRSRREHMLVEDRDVAEPGIQSLTPSLSYSLLSTDWEQQAITHFFYHYVSYPKNGGQGYLKFLPDLYTKNSDNEYLKNSLLAVSMATLGNISCMQQLQINSLRHYGHALQAVSRALQSPLEEAKINLLLTTIVLFQKYETITGTMTAPQDPHEAGLAELLRQHRTEQLQSSEGRSLLRIIQRRRLLRILDGTEPLPAKSDLDFETLSSTPLIAQLWHILYAIARSCSEIQSNTSQPELLSQTLNRAFSVHSDLVAWQEPLFLDRKYQTIAMPKQEEITFPKMIHLFEDVHHAATWLTYWCGRVHLLRSLILGLDALLGHTHTAIFNLSKYELQVDLNSVIEDICASAPFMMEEVNEKGELIINSERKALGAFYLLWGIHVANSVESMPLDQRRWILDCLSQIGHSRGIKLAFRSRDRWLELHKDTLK